MSFQSHSSLYEVVHFLVITLFLSSYALLHTVPMTHSLSIYSVPNHELLVDKILLSLSQSYQFVSYLLHISSQIENNLHSIPKALVSLLISLVRLI